MNPAHFGQQHNRPDCSPCLLFPLYPSLLHETLFSHYTSPFGNSLFSWNWKLFAKSTVDKLKVSWNSTMGPMNSTKNKQNSSKNKLNSKIFFFSSQCQTQPPSRRLILFSPYNSLFVTLYIFYHIIQLYKYRYSFLYYKKAQHFWES